MTMMEIVTVYHLPSVIEPIILTDPYKGSHVLRWNKSRGNPDSSRMGVTSSRDVGRALSPDDDDMGSTCTPYRLPRLSPRGDQDMYMDSDHLTDDRRTPNNDKVWSRHGYEKIIRIPELSPQIRVLIPPPKGYLHQARTATAPRFKQAVIAPTCRSVPWNSARDMNVDDSHLHLYRSNQSHDGDVSAQTTRLEPTPTPISRADSPAKSVKSIHWILGHNRYHTFDKKGRSHVQGPYSREFNVTCMAPPNWLRMKLGRSKTMIH